MAKETFNWRGLFINEEKASEEQVKNPVTPETTKFPDYVQQPNQPISNNVANHFLDEILNVYEKGFESLNETGFDFFEMYKSVMAVGASNPQSYQMAFAMGKSINSVLTKEFLLEKAKYYISEIEKVHAKYDASGKSKKTTLENSITAEKYNVSKTIEDLEKKIAQLQAELELKKAEFQKIDINNGTEFTEIQLKLEANNHAKQRILDSINTVVTGINQYL